MKSNKGFTLIELLVVIAIIGILSSVVLASLTSARARAGKAGAIATGRALIPEILTCQDDGGYLSTLTATQAGGGAIVCVTASGGSTGVAGHTVTWSSLPSGWVYVAQASALASGVASFALNDPNSTTDVTCTIATSVCQ